MTNLKIRAIMVPLKLQSLIREPTRMNVNAIFGTLEAATIEVTGATAAAVVVQVPLITQLETGAPSERDQVRIVNKGPSDLFVLFASTSSAGAAITAPSAGLSATSGARFLAGVTEVWTQRGSFIGLLGASSSGYTADFTWGNGT